MTSPSSEAGGIFDDVSVKKAGQRVTKSTTAQRTTSVQRGKSMCLMYLWGRVLSYVWDCVF